MSTNEKKISHGYTRQCHQKHLLQFPHTGVQSLQRLYKVPTSSIPRHHFGQRSKQSESHDNLKLSLQPNTTHAIGGGLHAWDQGAMDGEKYSPQGERTQREAHDTLSIFLSLRCHYANLIATDNNAQSKDSISK